MADVIDSTTWKNIVGKNFSVLGMFGVGKKMMIYVVRLTFGGATTYATGGLTENLKQRGAKTLRFVSCENSDIGYTFTYNYTTGKVQVWASGGSELANASAALQNHWAEFFVIAQS